MKTYKEIAFAYPTSTNAEHFDMSITGCYYIAQRLVDIDGSGQCSNSIHPQADSEGFKSPQDPDLHSLLAEVEGEIHPESLKHHPEYYPSMNDQDKIELLVSAMSDAMDIIGQYEQYAQQMREHGRGFSPISKGGRTVDGVTIECAAAICYANGELT